MSHLSGMLYRNGALPLRRRIIALEGHRMLLQPSTNPPTIVVRFFGVKSKAKRGTSRRERRIAAAKQKQKEAPNNPPATTKGNSSALDAFIYLVLFPAMAMPLVVEFGLPDYDYVSPYSKFYLWCVEQFR